MQADPAGGERVRGSAPAGAGVVVDSALDSLATGDSAELRQAANEVRGAQQAVVTRDAEGVLIVQGGLGTGRTMVGLQRVSWLLDRALDPSEVLIVGPHPTYVRYVNTVLPAPAESGPVRLPIAALGPRVRVTRIDPPPLRRLKGDRRMLRVIMSALRNRQRVDRGTIELRVDGHVVRIDGSRIAARARQLAGRPHNEAARDLRSFLVDELRSLMTRGARGLEAGARNELVRAVDAYLEQAWPTLTPQAFLVDLLSTPRLLEAAAAGLLNDDETQLLAIPEDVRVGAWQWSADDVPLLDAADVLLNGPPATYRHILVDEAQDLSPMQLESVRRRSATGSMTLLGDLAQGTSSWAHPSWEELALHVRRDRVSTEIVELDLDYRLPAEVHEVAARLIEVVAPERAAPRPVRPYGDGIVVVDAGRASSGDLAQAVVSTVEGLLDTGVVGVVVPARQRARVAAALERAGLSWSPELRGGPTPIILLSPAAAKGLEVDAVVVVEPEQIVSESEHGLRSLLVAVTRGTRRLALVHQERLPTELGPVDRPPPRRPEPSVSVDQGSAQPPRPEPTVPGVATPALGGAPSPRPEPGVDGLAFGSAPPPRPESTVDAPVDRRRALRPESGEPSVEAPVDRRPPPLESSEPTVVTPAFGGARQPRPEPNVPGADAPAFGGAPPPRPESSVDVPVDRRPAPPRPEPSEPTVDTPAFGSGAAAGPRPEPPASPSTAAPDGQPRGPGADLPGRSSVPPSRVAPDGRPADPGTTTAGPAGARAEPPAQGDSAGRAGGGRSDEWSAPEVPAADGAMSAGFAAAHGAVPDPEALADASPRPSPSAPPGDPSATASGSDAWPAPHASPASPPPPPPSPSGPAGPPRGPGAAGEPGPRQAPPAADRTEIVAERPPRQAAPGQRGPQDDRTEVMAALPSEPGIAPYQPEPTTGGRQRPAADAADRTEVMPSPGHPDRPERTSGTVEAPAPGAAPSRQPAAPPVQPAGRAVVPPGEPAGPPARQPAGPRVEPASPSGQPGWPSGETAGPVPAGSPTPPSSPPMPSSPPPPHPSEQPLHVSGDSWPGVGQVQGSSPPGPPPPVSGDGWPAVGRGASGSPEQPLHVSGDSWPGVGQVQGSSPPGSPPAVSGDGWPAVARADGLSGAVSGDQWPAVGQTGGEGWPQPVHEPPDPPPMPTPPPPPPYADAGDDEGWPTTRRPVSAEGVGMTDPGVGGRVPSRTDEMTASDMEWGEPVWSDAVPAEPSPPAVDWRKSIPREFVARTSPANRPTRESVRPDIPTPTGPTTNGHPRAAPDPGPIRTTGPSPATNLDSTTSPGQNWPVEPADARPADARHFGPDEPARANGINGSNGTGHTHEPAVDEVAPAHVARGLSEREDQREPEDQHDDDLGNGVDDTNPWNELDREIARALATTLAGKLSRYVTGPILPLVADELARLVGSSQSQPPAEGKDGDADGGQQRPRHLGDGTPPHR
jgi:hypothetical protein